MTSRIDIGHGVTIQRTENQAGELWGWIETHPHQQTGEPCSGSIAAAGGPGDKGGYATWTVECLDPLTLSPSILCRDCGHHGFVKAGKWIPA